MKNMRKKISISNSNKLNDQHSLAKSFLLHIIPGTLATAAILVFKQLIDLIGYPPLLAFLLAILLIDILFMLGVMLIEGKKLNGRFSLEGVVLYREKVSWKTFALVFVGAFIVLYLIIMLFTPLSSMLAQSVFSWLPEWIFFDDAAQYEGYPKNILILVFTLQLAITGLILPWIEELYFRGYLLPRISRYGGWAPLISGLMFGLYHGWQLYGWVGVSLLGVGLGYVVWWKKDIRLSISLHVFANAIVRLVLLMSVMTM
jgi:membrane protease YdiL (CAAX protease family)